MRRKRRVSFTVKAKNNDLQPPSTGILDKLPWELAVPCNETYWGEKIGGVGSNSIHR